jgi:hypothetical protein
MTPSDPKFVPELLRSGTGVRPLFEDGMIEAPLVERALPPARGIEARQAVAAGAR